MFFDSAQSLIRYDTIEVKSGSLITEKICENHALVKKASRRFIFSTKSSGSSNFEALYAQFQWISISVDLL